MGREPDKPGRISAELWPLIRNEVWSFVSPQGFVGGWPNRLWKMEKMYHYIGGQGASGIGYGAPASVGAALANRKYGPLSINIQTDGEFTTPRASFGRRRTTGSRCSPSCTTIAATKRK